MSRGAKGTVRWREIDQRARELMDGEPKVMIELLRQLARDERFPAVVALLRQLELEWGATASAQAMAACHGKLAHANGSHFGVRHAIARLQTTLSESSAAGMEPER